MGHTFLDQRTHSKTIVIANKNFLVHEEAGSKLSLKQYALDEIALPCYLIANSGNKS